VPGASFTDHATGGVSEHAVRSGTPARARGHDCTWMRRRIEQLTDPAAARAISLSDASTFTGLRFENPFLLSSAPPTESDSNIMRAFEAGWGGVVTKTIGLHPVVNVAGPKTKFLRADADSAHLSMKKRPAPRCTRRGTGSSSPTRRSTGGCRDRRIKKAFPIACWSRRSWPARAATGAAHWQTLAKACQDEGADALELNLSCPHMDRKDMGSNIGKDQELISIVTQVVKEVAKVPVWAKLTPSTTDIVVEARGAFLGGADAIVSSNTFPSLPLIDPETLEFEMNVDGSSRAAASAARRSCRCRWRRWRS
jgi:dihydropyrimidine dehydrogenase (NAD+) subunit PreA